MEIKKIACCTDFSESAHVAVEMAIDLAEKYQARLSIIHVVTSNEILPHESLSPVISKYENQIKQVYGGKIGDKISYEPVALMGADSPKIIKYVEENDMDMVVMGAYGLSGVWLVFLGSVAKRVADKCPCTVMIVRDREKTVKDQKRSVDPSCPPIK